MDSDNPKVGIVMGSDSDWPLVQKACATLDGFGVPYETRVISAHRTPELADGKDGLKEFREHWEIVLFDQGINIWHHEFKDGKPSWYLAAYLEAPFVPKERHVLTVRVQPRRGRMVLTAACGGKEFGYFDPDLPPKFHVGLTACEGPCRFYDFKVKTDIQQKKR